MRPASCSLWFALLLAILALPVRAADVMFVVGDSTSVAVAKGVQEFRRKQPELATKMP